MKVQPCPGQGLTPVLSMALDAAQSIFDEQTSLFYWEDDTGIGDLRYVTERSAYPMSKETGSTTKGTSLFFPI